MNEGVYFLLAGVTASLGITCQHFRLTKRCTAIGCLGVGVGSGDHQ